LPDQFVMPPARTAAAAASAGEVCEQGAALLALLFPHLAGLRVDRVEDTGSAVVISASCRAGSACCPRCGQESSRVHGGYSRVVADGAVGGRPVLIALRARRFRCQQPGCPQVTFAGQAEGLTARYPAAQRAADGDAGRVRGVDRAVYEAAADLRELGDDYAQPADLADLYRAVADVPGVNLAELLTTLDPGQYEAREMLRELTARARQMAAGLFSSHLAAWDPVISALLAAVEGDERAATALDEQLTRYQDSESWGALAAALSHLRAGGTGGELLTGLDEIDTAIVTRAVDAITGKIIIPARLWEAMPLGPLLGDLVAARRGDEAAAERARQVLDTMSKDTDLSPLATVLGQILGGELDLGRPPPARRSRPERDRGHLAQPCPGKRGFEAITNKASRPPLLADLSGASGGRRRPGRRHDKLIRQRGSRKR